MSAIAWGLIVWGWPGLNLGNGAGSRGLQPAVLIAAASIQAAVVVFGLAIGAIVLQVMSKYSWAVVRSVLSCWLIPVLGIAVGAGVAFPLWVSFSPTQGHKHGRLRRVRLVGRSRWRRRLGDGTADEPPIVVCQSSAPCPGSAFG